MTDLADPPPRRDLLVRALEILDEVEAADDDQALEPLEELRKRAVEAALAGHKRDR
ncbi:MAG: hypothetical protein ACFCVK_04005 [Acidimicrobiales bacterium]